RDQREVPGRALRAPLRDPAVAVRVPGVLFDESPAGAVAMAGGREPGRGADRSVSIGLAGTPDRRTPLVDERRRDASSAGGGGRDVPPRRTLVRRHYLTSHGSSDLRARARQAV